MSKYIAKSDQLAQRIKALSELECKAKARGDVANAFLYHERAVSLEIELDALMEDEIPTQPLRLQGENDS